MPLSAGQVGGAVADTPGRTYGSPWYAEALELLRCEQGPRENALELRVVLVKQVVGHVRWAFDVELTEADEQHHQRGLNLRLLGGEDPQYVFRGHSVRKAHETSDLACRRTGNMLFIGRGWVAKVTLSNETRRNPNV